MIISLSSKGEPSNADFKNYMSDAFIIPPNASVALVNCSFTKPSADGKFRITNTNNSFYIKFNAYDISKQIVIANGDYLIPSLVAALNTAVLDISPIWIVEFEARVVNANDVIVMKFLRHDPDDWDGYYSFSRDILGNYKTKVNAFLLAAGASNNLNTLPTQNALTSQLAVDMVGQDPTAVVRNWAFSAHPTSSFTPNINQPTPQTNGGAFEMGRYNGYTHFTFTAPDVNNVLYVGENFYRNGAYGNITLLENAAIFKITTNVSNSTIYSSVRDAPNSWSDNAAQEYEPGMTVCVSMEEQGGAAENGFEPRMSLKYVPNFNTWFMPLDFANGYNVVNGWTDYTGGVPAGGGAFQLEYLDYNDWMGTEPLTTMSQDNWNTSGFNRGVMGSYVGTGSSFRNTLFLVNNGGGAAFKNDNTLSNMPNNGGLKFERVVGGVLNYNMTIDLDYNNNYWTGGAASNPVLSEAKTLVSIGFKPRDDTGSARMTIFGGWSAAAGAYLSALQVDVGLGAGGMVNITDYGGDVFTFAQSNWVNASGASFGGFAYEGTYYVGLATKGSGGSNKIDVYIVDKSNYTNPVSDVYKFTITMNTYQLLRIKYIGGQQDPATNAASSDQRFNGYMWGFNVSQANTADTRVLSGDGMTFFTKFAIIAKAMVGTDDWVASDFNVPTSRTPATAANIFEVEQALNSRQIGVSYSNQNNISNVASEGWFSLGNFHHSYIQEITNSNKFTSTAPAISFVGAADNAAEIGVVNDPDTTSLMKDLQIIELGENRQTEPYTDMDSLEPEVVLELVGAGEPISSINTNDEVMNVNIENLPHTTFNGYTHSQTKSIYQLPQNLTKEINGNQEQLDFVVPERVYIPLNNLAEFPANHLHVRITDAEDITEENLIDNTHILLDIK